MAPFGGATEEDFYCTEDMGLSQADVTAIRDGWQKTMDTVKEAVLAHGGFAWPYFSARGIKSLDLSDPRPECAAYHRSQCVAGGGAASKGALMFEFTRAKFHSPFPLPFAEQDAASFLLVRGPYAWIGFSWMGCTTEQYHTFQRPAQLDVDYGEPTEASCRETATGSGVFTREWSRASITLDCNTWNATIRMKK